MGRAYLFIASLYATSVNSCGTNEFEKRMTYVAAYNKAVRASKVDPSMSSVARKFIRKYKANFPSKKVIFTEKQIKMIAESEMVFGCPNFIIQSGFI